jgi:hypothetical protein
MTPQKSPGRPKGTPKTGGRKRGTRNKRTRALQERLVASGMDPLAFMLSLMRNRKAPLEMRFEAAKQAAPYCHAKLSAIEHNGADGGAVHVEVKQYSDIEAARLIGRFLTKVASHNGHSEK